MFFPKKILLCALSLAPLAQAHCWHEEWASRIIERVDNKLSISAAKAIVSAYLGLGLVGLSSLKDCSVKIKLAGCSAIGLLIGLTNFASENTSGIKKSFIKGAASTCLIVTWFAIPELLLDMIVDADQPITESTK